METCFTNTFKVSKHQMQFMIIMENIYKNHINVNIFSKFLQDWGNYEAELIKKGTRYQKNYINYHPTTKEQDTAILNEYRTKIKELENLFMCRDFKIKQYQSKCAMFFTSFKNNIMFINWVDLFYNKVLKQL